MERIIADKQPNTELTLGEGVGVIIFYFYKDRKYNLLQRFGLWCMGFKVKYK